MTKWGMPGVYTHAFMDGWSPGYLGSVAYNHNGMMRMYETQSGRESAPGRPGLGGAGRRECGSARCGRCRGRCGWRDVAAPRRSWCVAVRGGGAGGRRGARARRQRRGWRPRRGRSGRSAAARATMPTGRGGGQPREWYRGIADSAERRRTTSRAATTRTTWRRACCRRCSSRRCFRNMVLENFYLKTKHSLEAGSDAGAVRLRIPGAARHDAKSRRSSTFFARRASRSARSRPRSRSATTRIPPARTSIKLNQPYGRLAKNLLEKQDYPDPALTTYDDSGWSMGYAFDVDVKEIDDKSILDAPRTPVKVADREGHRRRQRHRRPRRRALRLEQHDHLPLSAEERPDEDRRESFTAEGVTFPAGSFIDRLGGGPARRASRPSSRSVSPRRRCRRCRPCRRTTPTCRASRSTRSGAARRSSAGIA